MSRAETMCLAESAKYGLGPLQIFLNNFGQKSMTNQMIEAEEREKIK